MLDIFSELTPLFQAIFAWNTGPNVILMGMWTWSTKFDNQKLSKCFFIYFLC